MRKKQRIMKDRRITIQMTILIAHRMKISLLTLSRRSLWASANSSSRKRPSCPQEATMTHSSLMMRAMASPIMLGCRTKELSRSLTATWALTLTLSFARPTKTWRHRKALSLQESKIRSLCQRQSTNQWLWTKTFWRHLGRSRTSRSTAFNSTLRLLSHDIFQLSRELSFAVSMRSKVGFVVSKIQTRADLGSCPRTTSNLCEQPTARRSPRRINHSKNNSQILLLLKRHKSRNSSKMFIRSQSTKFEDNEILITWQIY